MPVSTKSLEQGDVIVVENGFAAKLVSTGETIYVPASTELKFERVRTTGNHLIFEVIGTTRDHEELLAMRVAVESHLIGMFTRVAVYRPRLRM